jgi:uroporphyrinogen decarboxylase
MGKNQLFDTLQHKPLSRASWVPFAGVHAGKLTGYTALEVLTDGDKLLESLLAVHRIYQPDGMPVMFDLQLEAEALGCELHWATNTPPSVKSHPLGDEAYVPCDCKIPQATDGRFPMVLEVTRKLKQAIGDSTAIYGLVCGPFTLASHLRGTNIFFDMYDDEQYVIELLEFCKKVVLHSAKMHIEAGADVIAVVDPLVSQISEEHFEQFLTLPYKGIFEELRNLKTFSAFFVCGDATRNIELMCQTKPDCISIDENIDIKTAKALTDKYNIVIGGNLQLTVTMLHGTQAANMKAAVDIIESCSINNLILSPGCDMPYDTPIDNVIAVSQAVLNFENSKAVIQNYDASLDLSQELVVLPDYQNLVKPLVEVFTLDSASCAACGYMINVVNKTLASTPMLFDYVEYKFTIKENIKRCMQMGVKHLPSLYINGELVYSSITPSDVALLAEIKQRL